MSENQQDERQDNSLPEDTVDTGNGAVQDVNITDGEQTADSAPSEPAQDESPAPSEKEEQVQNGGDTPPAESEKPENSDDLDDDMPSDDRYCWNMGRQSGRDQMKKKRGIRAYAFVMTIAFAVSFGILLAVLTVENRVKTDSGTPQNDSVSKSEMEPIENAKRSVVVIEVTTESGTGTGTGVILTTGGYIATNQHVIDGAQSIRITFLDGTQTEATVVGSSAMDDLAVVKVDASAVAEQLYPATFVESTADNYVGQTVYAIGTPGGAEFAFTTTKGIISYINREVRQYNSDGTMAKKVRTIQTDAMVNPGNSGGPLVDTEGRVVGIVSMKLGDGYEGIGFAIPSDGALEILNAIIKDGNADSVNSSLSFRRPLLGIVGVYVEEGHTYVMDDSQGRIVDCDGSTVAEIRNQITQSGGTPGVTIQADASGVYVISVTAGMGAEGKLQVGDIILSVEGVRATSMSVLTEALNDRYVGDSVTVQIERGSSTETVEIVLSAQKD